MRVAAFRTRMTVILGLGLTFASSGCALFRHRDSDARGANAVDHAMVISNSEIEISYLRGRNVHRFMAKTQPHSAVAQSFVNRSLLKEGRIDLERYATLVTRTSNFASSVAGTASARTPSSTALCRNPYTVTVRIGKSTQTANGCKTSADGTTLSQLLQEAEFLLYSQK